MTGSALVVAALASTGHLAVDVPTTLQGNTYEPNAIVRIVDGTYSSAAALPAGTAISALHREPSVGGTHWLFSPAHPVTLAGVTYEPRDVAAWDGTSFTMHLDGGAAGIPADARIDALLLDPGGSTIVSFDTPALIAGVDYGPSDLVLAGPAVSLWWDGDGAGVPVGTNLVGAAIDPAGLLVVTFDVPTTIAGATFIPGQLVRYNAGAFGLYDADPNWPPQAQLRDFDLTTPAGAIPDGGARPGTPLTVGKGDKEELTLAWGTSCSGLDSDYEVYEGVLEAPFDAHAPRQCSTGGATTATFRPEFGNRYFLVVPRNALVEGSQGVRSDGSERSSSAVACLIREIAACTP